MDTIRRRHHPVRKAHTPGQRSLLPVVAVARKKASDTPDGIAKRSRWRARVEEFPNLQLRSPTHQQHRAEPAKKTAKPRKAITTEQQRPRMFEEQLAIVRLQQMIELRTQNSCQSR